MSWFIQAKQKFICDNSIQVRSSWAAPLDHGTTYAAWLTTGIRGRNGETPSASSDFIAMLEENAPGGDLDNAWTTYQPLRDFFADAETPFDGSDVVSAAVFTTHDPDAEMAAIRAGVRAQPAPTLRDVTVCAEGVSSPCEALEGQKASAAARAPRAPSRRSTRSSMRRSCRPARGPSCSTPTGARWSSTAKR